MRYKEKVTTNTWVELLVPPIEEVEKLGVYTELYGTPADLQEYKEFVARAREKYRSCNSFFLEEGNSEKWVSFFKKDKNCPFAWDYDPEADGYLEFWFK